MAIVLFYEKPGCINNTRQKVLLAAAGHTVQAKSLLTEKWTAERLRTFFGTLPVTEWFNPSSPRVREGEVVPALLDEPEALRLMLADPLLVRRPLMEVEGRRRVGFDQDAVDHWIGLSSKMVREDLETCPRQPANPPCPPLVKGDSIAASLPHPANAATATPPFAKGGLGYRRVGASPGISTSVAQPQTTTNPPCPPLGKGGSNP